jgi:hypothetical protein
MGISDRDGIEELEGRDVVGVDPEVVEGYP